MMYIEVNQTHYPGGNMKLKFMGLWEKSTGNQLKLGTEGKVLELRETNNGLLLSKNDFGIENPINQDKETTKTNDGVLIENKSYKAIYQYV